MNKGRTIYITNAISA